MKWYVSRNGQTVGPVDAHQVDAWISGGMDDAWVMNDVDGKWVSLNDSPFISASPPNMILGAAIAFGGLLVASIVIAMHWDTPETTAELTSKEFEKTCKPPYS